MDSTYPDVYPGGPPLPAEGVAEGHPAPAGPALPLYPQASAYAYQPPFTQQQQPALVMVATGGFAGLRTAPAREAPHPGQVVVGWESEFIFAFGAMLFRQRSCS